MRFLAALFGLLLITGSAQAASTINTAQPLQGIPYNASPVRLNFGAAANDINALQTLNAGASAPSNPSLGYLWVQTGSASKLYPLSVWDGVKWLPIGTVDAATHLWTPPVGGGAAGSLLSAAMTDLGSVAASSVTVTGNNPIFSFGASAPPGTIKFVTFSGSPTLNYNATSLLLPTKANISVSAGDTVIAQALGAGSWNVLVYQPVSGFPINIFTAGQVQNTTALRNACTSTIGCPLGDFVFPNGVIRWTDGVAGAPPLPYSKDTAGVCSADDGGHCVAAAGGGYWLAQFSGPADVREWGAVGNGVTDATAAINAALAVEPSVLIPAGQWVVSNELFCRSGNSLTGVSGAAGGGLGEIAASTIIVPNTFNLSANGVIQAGTPNSTPGCTISNLQVAFTQPDFNGMTISNIVHYPPAIDNDNIHISNIDNISATNAWTCFSAASPVSPTGGTHISRFDCSSYNRGWYIQGNTAFMKITSWDQETFGMSPNQTPVYEAAGVAHTALCGEHNGAPSIGSSITVQAQCFDQGIQLDAATDSSASLFPALSLDGDGATFINNGANAQIIGGYSTKGTGQTLLITNGNTSVTNFRFGDGTTPTDVTISNGSLNISNSSFVDTSLSSNQISVTGGSLFLFGNLFSVAATSRTAPLIEQTAGVLVMKGNDITGAGVATGNILQVNTDAAANIVSENNFNGWPVDLAFSTTLGYYDMGDVPFALTVTPQFTTEGDFAPTGNTYAASFYFRRGDFVDLSLSDQFTANAYTTAGGFFELALNAPSPTALNQGCPIAFMNNVTSSQPVTATISGTNMIFIRNISGAAAQNLGTANVPASTANVQFVATCRYRVR